jgi:hypothetical protein
VGELCGLRDRLWATRVVLEMDLQDKDGKQKDKVKDLE